MSVLLRFDTPFRFAEQDNRCAHEAIGKVPRKRVRVGLSPYKEMPGRNFSQNVGVFNTLGSGIIRPLKNTFSFFSKHIIYLN